MWLERGAGGVSRLTGFGLTLNGRTSRGREEEERGKRFPNRLLARSFDEAAARGFIAKVSYLQCSLLSIDER